MSKSTLLMIDAFEINDTHYRAVRDATGGTIELRQHVCESQEKLDALDTAGVHTLLTEMCPRQPERWKDLKLVQLVAAGTDYLGNDHPIWTSGLPVATATGIHSVPMAQFATGMLLSMVHRFQDLEPFQRTKKWAARETTPGTVIRGWTAGIVGYGSIGRECARQLAQLGMRIVAMKHDPSKHAQHGFHPWPGSGDPDGRLPERWFSPAQVSEMLPLCDVVVVTVPRNASTLGMIRAAELARMKPTARIIIISRGGIVDEKDLADALKSHRLAGAAVDCFVKEPPPADHPLFDAPNCIMTPHMSGVYDRYVDTVLQLACENIQRLRDGKPLFNVKPALAAV